MMSLALPLTRAIFHEVLDWYGARCKVVANAINENAPGNCQLTSREIQLDIAQACAKETTQVIMSGLENVSFSLLLMSLIMYRLESKWLSS
jgi:hypothetical protein